LRFAIDQLHGNDRSWALGALICAVSSCAHSYGGHFAQPRVDADDVKKFSALAEPMLTSRGLSVSHEFFVRLTSLAAESAEANFKVEPIEGPWEKAMDTAAELVAGAPVCVYLDPPYTRDEYSRYYHVLETLVRYDYPHVAGKPSIPRRGERGRFASPFATRSTSQVELLLERIIRECMQRGWSCLWSYSNSGVAAIDRVIGDLSGSVAYLEMFAMDHAYKGQGRHSSKTVKEYVCLMRPNAGTC
jgi:hypothetical protein